MAKLPKLCKCGCGREVQTSTSSKTGLIYYKGYASDNCRQKNILVQKAKRLSRFSTIRAEDISKVPGVYRFFVKETDETLKVGSASDLLERILNQLNYYDPTLHGIEVLKTCSLRERFVLEALSAEEKRPGSWLYDMMVTQEILAAAYKIKKLSLQEILTRLELYPENY